MKLYHVQIQQDGKWFVGRVLERPGVITQGRSLDELVLMLRDAIQLMWDERDVQLELIVPNKALLPATQRRRVPSKRAASTAA